MSGISQQVVPFAAEDRFILVGIRDAERMCPNKVVALRGTQTKVMGNPTILKQRGS